MSKRDFSTKLSVYKQFILYCLILRNRMYEKQPNKKKTHPQSVSLSMFGHISDKQTFNGISLCICQLFYSSGTLTHCGSLSDQINVSLPFSAMQQPAKHITDAAIHHETPTASVQTHQPSSQVALKVTLILESKQQIQRAAVTFYSSIN